MKKKSEAFDKFKMFKEMVENESDLKIKCLWAYNAGKFTSNYFENFSEKNGIKI